MSPTRQQQQQRPASASTLQIRPQAQSKPARQSLVLHNQQQQARHATQALPPSPSVQLFHSRPPPSRYGNFYVPESGVGGSSQDEDEDDEYPPAIASLRTLKGSVHAASATVASPAAAVAALSVSASAVGGGAGAVQSGVDAKREGASARSVAELAATNDRESGGSSSHLRSLMSELLSSLRKLHYGHGCSSS